MKRTLIPAKWSATSGRRSGGLSGIVAATVTIALLASGPVAVAAVEGEPGVTGMQTPAPVAAPIGSPAPTTAADETPTLTPAPDETPDPTLPAPEIDPAPAPVPVPAPTEAAAAAAATQSGMPTTRPVLTPVLGYDAVYVQHEERGGPGVQGMFRLAAPTEAGIVGYEVRVGEQGAWTSYPVTAGEMLVPFTPDAPGNHLLFTRWVDASGLTGSFGLYRVQVAGDEPGPTQPAVSWWLPVAKPGESGVRLEILTGFRLPTKIGQIRVLLGSVELARFTVADASHTVVLDRAALGSGNVPVTIEYVAVPGDTPWTTEAVVCGNDCVLSSFAVDIVGMNAGQPLRASLVSEAVPAPEAYSYQWLVDGAPIEGAKNATYLPPPWFEGRQVAVEVAASRQGYADSTAPVRGMVLGLAEDPTITLQAQGPEGLAPAAGADASGTTLAGTPGRARELRGLRVWPGESSVQAWDVSDVRVSGYVRKGQAVGEYHGPAHLNPAGEQPLTALMFRVSGQTAEFYDVYYRAHVAGIGWLGWAKNGEVAGAPSYEAAMEAVEVKFVRKVGQEPPAANGMPASFEDPNKKVRFQAHVENLGWQREVEGWQAAGTTGQGLRVEALKFRLEDPAALGGIRASAHVQEIGWQPFADAGEVVGTTGRALRVEAFKIELTGQMAQRYDIYYRTHAQEFGWLGWAKNGAPSGSAGYAFRLEAVEVRLVPKGLAGPDTPGVPAFKQR